MIPRTSRKRPQFLRRGPVGSLDQRDADSDKIIAAVKRGRQVFDTLHYSSARNSGRGSCRRAVDLGRHALFAFQAPVGDGLSA
jgi:hypothetical protein